MPKSSALRHDPHYRKTHDSIPYVQVGGLLQLFVFKVSPVYADFDSFDQATCIKPDNALEKVIRHFSRTYLSLCDYDPSVAV